MHSSTSQHEGTKVVEGIQIYQAVQREDVDTLQVLTSQDASNLSPQRKEPGQATVYKSLQIRALSESHHRPRQEGPNAGTLLMIN